MRHPHRRRGSVPTLDQRAARDRGLLASSFDALHIAWAEAPIDADTHALLTDGLLFLLRAVDVSDEDAAASTPCASAPLKETPSSPT